MEEELRTDDPKPLVEGEDFYMEEVIPGDTIEKVLSRVQYASTDLAKKVKIAIEQQVREGHIKPKEGVSLIDFYEETMNGYTYLQAGRT